MLASLVTYSKARGVGGSIKEKCIWLQKKSPELDCRNNTCTYSIKEAWNVNVLRDPSLDSVQVYVHNVHVFSPSPIQHLQYAQKDIL